MAKISEYDVAQSFDAGDLLLKDGSNGTKTIAVEDAAVYFEDSIDYGGKAILFSTPASRTAPATGDTIATVFGKLAKLFADLKSFVFQNMVDDLTAQTAGVAPLDAHQGYVIDQRIDTVDYGYKGTEIQANGDLWNCTDYGVYFSPNGTRTNTLSHKPSTLSVGFIMYVDSTGSGKRQTIYSGRASNPEIWMRQLSLNSSGAVTGFSTWYKVGMTEDGN